MLQERHFLLLRLSVTNGGGKAQGFPGLSLVNGQGEQFREDADMKDVSDPMGLIRILSPGETRFGWLMFDVPQNDYVLELTDGNLDNEKTALVELPLRLN